MFIGTEQNTIKQFFTDIGFLCPKGMQLDYFILPPESDVESVAPSAEYNLGDIVTDPKRGTTVVYQPKDTTKLYSNPKNIPAQTPTLPPMPYTPVPVQNIVNTAPVEDEGGGLTRVMSPEVKNKIAIIENTKSVFDMKLKESIENFPKGTFFHFKRS